MYNPSNFLQVGITGAVGGFNWGDAFCNIYPTGISRTHAKGYIGINAGYINYKGEYDNHPAHSVKGAGLKTGLQMGFTLPIFPRMTFYGESGACIVFATAQRSSSTKTGGWQDRPRQQESHVFVPIHFGLRYRLKM